MKFFRITLVALAVVLGTSSLLAEQLAEQQVPSSDPETLSQMFPGPLEDVTFGKVVAGDFTGDGSLDAVVMDGDSPLLLVSPEAFDTAIPVQDGSTLVHASDIAVLFGGAVDSARLLTVGVDGLERWTRIPGAWNRSTVRGVGTRWADAMMVRTGDLDGANGLDIVGIGRSLESGLTTRVLIETSDGSGGYITSSFSCAGAAYDIHMLDWDDDSVSGSDATDEIAVVTDLGVEVYEADGSFVAYFAWSLSPMLSAVIGHETSTAERLALVTQWGTQNQVSVFGQGGIEVPIAIGNVGVVRVAAGDLDGDGDEELLLSVNSAPVFCVLENLSPPNPGSTSSTFDGATIDLRAFGVPRNTSLNDAGIVTGDFDQDGDIDVFPPAQGSGSVAGEAFVYRWDNVVETDYRPQLGEDPDLDPTTNILTLDFTESAQGVPGFPSGPFGFDVTIWHTADLGIASDPVAYESFVAVGTTHSVQMPTSYDPHVGSDLYSVVLRQVALDAQSNILASGPALTAIIVPAVHWETIMFAPEVENQLPGIPSGDDPTIVGIGPRPPSFASGAEPGR